MNINSCNLVGRLLEDPKYTAAEGEKKSRAWFRLGINRRKDSEGKSVLDVVPVIVWGKLADAVANLCKKGKEVGVSGALHTRTTQDEAGNYSNYFEIAAREVSFGNDSKKQQAAPAAQASQEPQMSPELIKALAQALIDKGAVPGKKEAKETSTDHPFGGDFGHLL